ncbi:hypothetical protein QYE76_051619 [Lolium multiflorum]|uniref:Uncharacterized protein n=1 Tax=Lolium multiflorum TaxID=4521 RepID=A0AAD8WKQ5_LOLMU|nr:hypothetical protein QYE76_051619 [Lolium multiflorum]
MSMNPQLRGANRAWSLRRALVNGDHQAFGGSTLTALDFIHIDVRRYELDLDRIRLEKPIDSQLAGQDCVDCVDWRSLTHPKLSPPPETGRAHTPPLRRHAVLPSYLMASSAHEPPPPPPPPPEDGEGSASTRSTPLAVEFIQPSSVPIMPLNGGEDWESERSNAWIPSRSTTAPSVPNASGSQIVPTVDVEDDAEIEDPSPQDDDDEFMFPELVDRCSKQAMEDQYMEDIAQGARFDDTDDEEKDENNDSLILADYEGDDLPTIEWNREDPQLAEGTIFQTMMDCRNAVTTYCIITKNDHEVIKSEPGRSTTTPSVPNASGSQIVPAVDVDDDAEIEDLSPQDDDDELMFPELVDRYNLLMMKNTKTAAVPTVVIDAKNIEAIAYNIAATAQIQPSMSEPADVSLLLPSSDPLLMKNTKTAAVPIVLIDAKNIEAIAYNIVATAQIQPSMLTTAVPRVRIDAKTIEAIVNNRAAKPPIRR